MAESTEVKFQDFLDRKCASTLAQLIIYVVYGVLCLPLYVNICLCMYIYHLGELDIIIWSTYF